MEIRKELPEIFDDFADMRQKQFLAMKEIKDQGIPVVGAYCTYFPYELVYAAGAVSVGLCSTSDETIAEAEKDLPTNLCPMVKASYGFGKTDKCPYFYFSDIVVGETTCDGKKKMYELMKNFKEVYIMELPQTQREDALLLWTKEIIRFKEYLEDKLGVEITDEKIRKAVHDSNNLRKALGEFYGLMKLNPAPMMGKNLFDVLYGSQFMFDKQAALKTVEEAIAKVKEEYTPESGFKTKRILMTGCPSSGAPMKVNDAIEAAGANVVVFENCSGTKTIDRLIDEDADDIYKAIAERYLGIGCSVMTPNNNRMQLLEQLIKEFEIDGVVEMTLHACHTYNIEAKQVEKLVEGLGVPYIHIETDYSKSDVGQIQTRIGAFVEML